MYSNNLDSSGYNDPNNIDHNKNSLQGLKVG